MKDYKDEREKEIKHHIFLFLQDRKSVKQLWELKIIENEDYLVRINEIDAKIKRLKQDLKIAKIKRRSQQWR